MINLKLKMIDLKIEFTGMISDSTIIHILQKIINLHKKFRFFLIL